MTITETKHPTDAQRESICNLWNREYPAQLHYASSEAFDAYLNNLSHPYHWLVVDDSNNLIGWAFSFLRDGERWFAVIVDSSIQRKGLGTKLLQLLKARELVLNGWVTDHEHYNKSDGTPYASPLPFYIKNGFMVVPGVRIETEKLSAVKIKWTKS